MAATLIEEGREGIFAWGTVTLDSNYPDGGEAIDAIGDLGYKKVFFEAGTGIVAQWDKANQKVVAYWGNAGTASLLPAVTATTDLSAQVLDYLAIVGAK
jgi:hypothetical protein